MFVVIGSVLYKKYVRDDNEYLTLIAPSEIRQKISNFYIAITFPVTSGETVNYQSQTILANTS
ncbi:hypothetical protein MAR_018733 [Mya arenaria]|uniref:Uncharacterized protein n=1 Tax=Mya arenaria TaxID=6604 RepID=A0ABY7EFX3_MYAAR|nr:hypothetical protein MAR_018733 [Mya arenaria]